MVWREHTVNFVVLCCRCRLCCAATDLLRQL